MAPQKTDTKATTKTGKVVITPRKARTHGIALHL